ncbi:group I truncated hemoglobin [Agromyces sp. Marseille-Q5079]|uniref:group I truncated hemoglobin n=1 Tax=Agromyces sp. Marseille-Q5079 TaxID=3439059 RepID=UPI003D9CB3A0
MTTPSVDQSDVLEVSDYTAVGGAPAITAVVNRFYDLVVADERLAGYFEGVEMVRLKRHQVALVSQVMGGPVEYEGRELRAAHEGMGISSDDFAVVVGHLVTALTEAGVPSEIIGRVGVALGGTEADIVEVSSTRG